MFDSSQGAVTGARLTEIAVQLAPQIEAAGLQQGTMGFNRVMSNALDMAEEGNEVLGRFMQKLPEVVQQGATIETIARARTDSYMNEAGEWDYDQEKIGGYDQLYASQRALAGMFDYRGRVQ